MNQGPKAPVSSLQGKVGRIRKAPVGNPVVNRVTNALVAVLVAAIGDAARYVEIFFRAPQTSSEGKSPVRIEPGIVEGHYTITVTPAPGGLFEAARKMAVRANRLLVYGVSKGKPTDDDLALGDRAVRGNITGEVERAADEFLRAEAKKAKGASVRFHLLGTEFRPRLSKGDTASLSYMLTVLAPATGWNVYRPSDKAWVALPGETMKDIISALFPKVEVSAQSQNQDQETETVAPSAPAAPAVAENAAA